VKQGYRNLFCFLALAMAILGLVFAGQTSAQVISGDLVGTVLDKTGASVPGATVEAVNADTGAKYTAEASAVGEYRFSNLPVGTYNVSSWAANFAKTTVSAFKIELNKTTTLSITLEVKGAVTSIEVSGAAVTLDTTTSQLSTTFEDQVVSTLPSATTGSGVLNLSLLSSGVASSGGVGAGSGPSVGGQRPRNNNFTIEGVDNNSKSVTGPLVAIPNDAVAEFSLLQNNFSSEFGHSSGGQFNTVVKSGTNSFHGMAYIYNQNRNYFALDTQQKVQNGLTQVPRYDNNRFGGNVGGPVLKNKLFFFVNYEYQPVGQVGSAGAACAPDAAGVQTIKSYTPAAGDRPIVANNVNTFLQYVPVGTIPTAVSGCPTIFLGNNAKTQTAVTTQGLAFPLPSFSNTKNLVTSGDWNISTKDQLRARYIWNDFAGIDTAASLPIFFQTLPTKNYLVAINEYHQFSANLQNEFRFGFNRYFNITDAGSFKFPGLPDFPNLTLIDLGQLNIGPDGNAPQSAIQNTYQASEALSIVKGRHSYKVGFEARKVISPQQFTQRLRGDYYYDTLYQYLTDSAPANFAERSTGNAKYYGDQTAWYWFGQDNWRIRPNLTINLGLRYEYTTIPFTEKQQKLNAIASVPGLIDFRSPTAAKNNWAPRVGFAYSPGTSGKTSIRAGAGIAYDILYDNLGILSTPPEFSTTIDCGATFNCTAFDPTNPPYMNGFLAGGGLPSTASTTFPSQAAAAKKTSSYVPVDQKSPKSIDWTLGVQHQFASDYTVEVRYVGTRGIHLPSQIRLNRTPQVTSTVFLPTYTQDPGQAAKDALPYTLAGIKAGAYGNGDSFVPAYEAGNFNGSNLVAFEPWASSTYHGLAAQVTKRFSHGLQFVGAYTFSKTIDNATADVFSTVLAPRRAQDWLNLSADRSNSILDHRNRLTIGLLYDVQAFKHSNWLVKNVVGNWTIAPIYTFQTGQWATAQNAVDSNLNGDSAGDRPVFNPAGQPGTGSPVNALKNSAGQIVAYCACGPAVKGVPTNPNAQYIVAGQGARSTTGRSTLQLRPIDNIDMTVSKRINLTERYRVEFQVQAFNLFNHAQYIGGYLNDVASIGFTGVERNMLLPSNPDFNNPSTVFSSNPRNLQLALKFIF
jgi:hypothetical protein